MERRFKQRDGETMPRSPNVSDLTDDEDDSRVLIASSAKPASRANTSFRSKCLCVLASLLFAVVLLAHGLRSEWSNMNVINVVTWNIAAINNNPFEYWITHHDKDYNALMEAVQHFIDEPGEKDILVADVFSPSMWSELKELMLERGWNGVEETQLKWTNDYSQRRIISGFMKDKSIGDKRLASMPDRYTNTINTLDKGVANRPTVINCFEGDMSSLAKWWSQWKKFMFKTTLRLPGGGGAGTLVEPAGLLSKIKRSKYPAITSEEEAISIPLQTLSQAIFDAILIHIVNSVSANGKWQILQRQMCDALNRRKDEHTIGILESYAEAGVIFLQEAAASFINKAEESDLGERYQVVHSASLDGKRDQNSLILLSKSYFLINSVQELTSKAVAYFTDSETPIANGDLLVVAVDDVLGRKYLLASFHGDTNGLATLPVLGAVHKLAATMPTYSLIFGLDANTYEQGSSSKQGVLEFATDFVSKGYSSCWGDKPNPKSHTTFNARTFLQAQLQKAARVNEMTSKGDKNPKDFILFTNGPMSLLSSGKDNTGQHRYIEEMVFPTLDFPSDHGLVWAKLQLTPKNVAN